jgi:phage baseplate assembly protein gpV
LKIDGGSGDMEIKVGTDITITLSGSKVTIQADVEIQGDLTVKGSSGSTKISGNTVEGS